MIKCNEIFNTHIIANIRANTLAKKKLEISHWHVLWAGLKDWFEKAKFLVKKKLKTS